MLRVAVTGGIGSGKSTVAGLLAARGAAVVDSDQLAREVVQPGTPGLTAIVDRFGGSVLDDNGSLNRAALAAVVFADPRARRDLEQITHPAVRARFEALAAALPPATIVVNDIPLLLDLQTAASFHLVIGVGADPETRVARLIGRGLPEDDARARIAVQLDDEHRRPLTDGWIRNDGQREALESQVEELWLDRLGPFDDNVMAGVPAARGTAVLMDGDRSWTTAADRLLARVSRAAGDLTVHVSHVGSTAVPGLIATDVLDVQLVVPTSNDVAGVGPALSAAGFARVHGLTEKDPHGPDQRPAHWLTALHANADPGRAVDLHVRPATDPAWQWPLVCRDWLRADAAARIEYLQVKTRSAVEFANDPNIARYSEAKQRWWAAAVPRVQEWSDATGWTVDT